MGAQSNPLSVEAINRGIITKDNLSATVERIRAFEQRFDEAPMLDINKEMPAHHQVELEYFKNDKGVEIIFSLEDNLLHLRNTDTNTIASVDFEIEQGQVAVESVNTMNGSITYQTPSVNHYDAEELPQLASKLSKVKAYDNNGLTNESLANELRTIDPDAIWVEKSKFNEHFVLQEIVGNGQDRDLFLKEFEAHTGPQQFAPRQDYDDGMTP